MDGRGEEGESLGFMCGGMEGRMWQGKGEQKDAELDGGKLEGRLRKKTCASVTLSTQNLKSHCYKK